MARRSVRYTFILVLVAVGTCLAAVSGWRYARVSAPVNGPIVLITVDSLRADRLPAYGSKRLKTPALSALAADGLTFDRAYSHVPQTLPAHAALLSGRLPFETGVRTNVGAAVAPAERLLAEMLRDRGFTTGGVVSSFYLRPESGINQGFTFFDARINTPSVAGRPALSRAETESEQIAERWMDSIGTPRAFLFLHLDDPRKGPVAATGAAADDFYDLYIESVDGAIGKLVQYLEGRSFYEQATIIVTADHGEGLGAHQEQGHGLLVHNDTLRVPLIIKPPSGAHSGRRVADLVQHVDLVPTILDLAKAPIPGNLRGRSLAPLFEAGGSIAKTAVYSESLFASQHFGWAELTSVTDGRYRYVRAPREELYDHDSDPGEERNQIDMQPDVARRLRETLKGFADAATAATPEAVPLPVSKDDREKFDALGDVGTPIPGTEQGAADVNPVERVAYVERFRAAARFAAERDWPNAIEQYRALTKDQPDDADAWMHLAQSAANGERPDVALDGFKHVIQLAPEFADAHLGASQAALRLRRYDDARQSAQLVLDLPKIPAGTTAMAHELLARVAFNRRDLELARTEAKAAEEALPSRPVVGYIEGRAALEQKRYADALAALEPALAAVDKAGDAPLADLRLLTAEALMAVERFADAERLFTRELEDNPQSTRAKTGLATVLRSTGRRDEAASLTRH